MSDDNSDTPLDFPASEADYYPEIVEDSAWYQKNPYVWQSEILQLMEEVGCSPEVEDSSDEEYQSEPKDSDKEDEGSELVHSKLADAILCWCNTMLMQWQQQTD